MSTSESIERRKEQGEKWQAPDMWYWEPETLTSFFAAVRKLGLKGIERIEAVPGAREDGSPDLHLRIIPKADPQSKAAREPMEFNWSHPCPPDCPCSPGDPPPCPQ